MAQALHVHGQDVAKTVLLRANGGYRYIVAVLPPTKRIDLELAAGALGGSKLELATELEIAEHCPDCEIGALPPFGSQYGMKTLVDESLCEDGEIVFEGNTHEEAIRMKFTEQLGAAADSLRLSDAHVQGVASFYSMLSTKPKAATRFASATVPHV